MIAYIRQLGERMAKVERAIRSLPTALPARAKYPIGGNSGVGEVWCTVVERAVLATSGGVAYRWKYKLQSIQLTNTDTIELVAGDTTFGTWPDVYALNEMEFSNQAQHVGYQTTGINQAAPYPSGFALQPIGGGTGSTPEVTVPCYARQATRPDGTIVWLFTVANADNGSC